MTARPPLPPPNRKNRHVPKTFSPTTRDLPPLPTDAHPPPSSPSHDSESQIEFPCEDDKFTLPVLVDTYSSLFPIRVRVVKGYYGERGENSAIATDELYNFHFVKRAKVVSIKDVHGNKYIIPLNSAAKFGLVQDHHEKMYNTVEDLINAPSLPAIVAVQAGYVGDDPKTSVSKHELLIVHGVTKGGGGRFKIGRQNVLKVYSITKGEEKLLPKEVFGKFTTEPFHTQIYLMEFLEFIKDPVPSKVRLFLDFEGDQPLPDHLISEDVTIDRLYMETSIISSSLTEDEINARPIQSQCDAISTMEISINLDIEVSVIPPFEENDYEKLTAETMALLQNFDPSKVQHVDSQEGVTDDDDYDYSYAQDALFKAVRKGFENEGLKIDTPRKAMPVMSGSVKKMPPKLPEKEEVDVDVDDYVDVDEENIKPPLPPMRLAPAQKGPPPPPPPATKKRLPHSLSEETNLSAGHYKSPRSQSLADEDSTEAVLRAASYVKPTPSLRLPPTKAPSLDNSRSRSPSPPPKPALRRVLTPEPPPVHTDLHPKVNRKKSVPLPTSKKPLVHSPDRLKSTSSSQSELDSGTMQEDILDCQRDIAVVKDSLGRLDGVEDRMSSIEQNMKEMKDMLKALSKQAKSGGNHEEDANDPTSVLRMLDCEQIQQVLTVLRMNKYKEIFQDAQIDGEILADCDDDILEKELQVSSRLDRLKLLQIISGKRSVSEVLHKPNRSYVAFAPN